MHPTAPHARTTPRDATAAPTSGGARDLLLGAAVGFGWCVVVEVLRSSHWWNPRWVSAWWWCGLALAVVVATWRRHPRATSWGVVIGYPLVYRTGLQSELHLAPLLVAAFLGARAGAVGPVIGSVATAGGTLALLVPGGLAVTRDLDVWLLPWMPLVDLSYAVALATLACVAVVLGAVVHRLERTSADLAARNAELRRLQEERTERAVLAERTRIARELHDVVAHHVSAIVVRAQAANRVAGRRPEATAEATAWIAGAGKEALTAMRGLVHVLRADDRTDATVDVREPGTAGSSASAGVSAELAPAPGVDDVARAAQRLREAGVAVDLTLPDRVDLPPDVALAVARIAQEALTNVLLHSRATRADVRLDEVGGVLHLVVRDPGPRRPETPSGGHGLVHMRERARACGGRLDAGPADDGGWTVHASLPTTTLSGPDVALTGAAR
ncbi:sensor histidine kinase [Cellulomonas fimi]|uniref:sensor histidine kinase n=1 Tax=Cellulomonas fimi TaxID=1708 RepID=UPI00234C1CD7|nr:sensor histidine kinase [Cellulomonas fimi]MDC7121114.1 sensor histidine kinase [Cellulomonas fimi]